MDSSPNDALTLQFLDFVAARPRTYRETMEAWRTSCPRLSIWEDAVRDDLVRLVCAPGEPTDRAAVVLTAAGAARRAGQSAAAAEAG